MCDDFLHTYNKNGRFFNWTPELGSKAFDVHHHLPSGKLVHKYNTFANFCGPTCLLVRVLLALPRATFVHKYNTFASFCGPTCLLFRVLLALPRATFVHKRVVFINL